MLRALIIGMVIMSSSARAQNGSEPSELILLRQQFAQRALSSTRTLGDQYTKALAALEDQAGASGDYETALAAQQRRQQLAAWNSNVTVENSDAIILRPGDAKITGTTSFNRKEGVLDNWRNTACTANWDILRLTPGTYTVTLTYGAAAVWDGEFRPFGIDIPERAPDPVGEVELSEVTSLNGTAVEKLTYQVKPTDGMTTHETVTLGDMKLNRTSGRIMLKVNRLRGNYGLMQLKEIRLVPVRPGVVKVDETAAREYAAEHQSHRERLTALGQPVVESYIERLQRISDVLEEKNDAEGVQSLLNESKRARQSLQALGKETKTEPGAAIIRPDGLEEIKDVRYVPDPTNTGDRFLVSTPNQIIAVRLMSVSCPSPRAEDEENHRLHSGYFGITADDSVAVGRQAQEFTETYLKNKPLRLLTRWMRDKSGAVLAIVQPGEVGDFSGILVDNGLAAISSPKAKSSVRNRVEETLRTSLKEREIAAKAKAIPPGAWSFLPMTSQP